MDKDSLFGEIERERDTIEHVADELWNHPELAFNEHQSAQLLIKIIESNGFEVNRLSKPLSTAFIASYGSGSPTIGILAEYDALPDMSQKVMTDKQPITDGAPGHGCGHNLFSAGSLGGALAIKRAIERDEIRGTIKFIGCPAEEVLTGKVLMEREGVFDDLDAALAWHPWHLSAPFRRSMLAMNSVKYSFQGTSAHAAAAPEAGRSAVDGVSLLNTGVEYMREHIPNSARVHYTITDGGKTPNIVPSTGEVFYFVRAPERKTVRSISNWVSEIAEGAATMTQTDVSEQVSTGTYEYIPNSTITEVMYENMERIGPIDYTDEDQALARELLHSLAPETISSQLGQINPSLRKTVQDRSLYSVPVDPYDPNETLPVSSDIGNVSWIVPTGQFWATTWPVGTPAHTWQAVAASGSFGGKGAVFASKVLATTAYELMTNPATLEQAKEEFRDQIPESEYNSFHPDNVSSPILPPAYSH